MTELSPQTVTQWLLKWRGGDESALNDLSGLVYEDLHRLAHNYLRQERPDHTLQATGLVHEAYLQLHELQHIDWKNRAQFIAVVAQVMRHVLVDHARAVGSAKRGGGGRVQWDTNFEVAEDSGSRQLKVLEVHSALEALERKHGSLAQVVEMHYFGGMTAEEAALVAGRSVHVVRHELRLAHAWMRRELAR